jgi:hypothetical protein
MGFQINGIQRQKRAREKNGKSGPRQDQTDPIQRGEFAKYRLGQKEEVFEQIHHLERFTLWRSPYYRKHWTATRLQD